MHTRRICIAACLLLTALAMLSCGKGERAERVFKIDAARRIEVFSRVSYRYDEFGRRHFYMRAVDADKVSRNITISNRTARPEFEIVMSRDGNLVGLWEKDPGLMVVCFDFSTGQPSPFGTNSGINNTYEKTLVAWIRSLEKLQDGFPERAYVREDFRKELDAGNGRKIVITGFSAGEGGHTRIYQVLQNGKAMILEADLAAMDRSQRDYDLVSAEGGNLVAVVARDSPKRVFVLHDFTTGLSWPAGPGGGDAALQRYFSLVGRIGKEHPGLTSDNWRQLGR